MSRILLLIRIDLVRDPSRMQPIVTTFSFGDLFISIKKMAIRSGKPEGKHFGGDSLGETPNSCRGTTYLSGVEIENVNANGTM